MTSLGNVAMVPELYSGTLLMLISTAPSELTLVVTLLLVLLMLLSAWLPLLPEHQRKAAVFASAQCSQTARPTDCKPNRHSSSSNNRRSRFACGLSKAATKSELAVQSSWLAHARVHGKSFAAHVARCSQYLFPSKNAACFFCKMLSYCMPAYKQLGD